MRWENDIKKHAELIRMQQTQNRERNGEKLGRSTSEMDWYIHQSLNETEGTYY